jgi:hypothetical protein
MEIIIIIIIMIFALLSAGTAFACERAALLLPTVALHCSILMGITASVGNTEPKQ